MPSFFEHLWVQKVSSDLCEVFSVIAESVKDIAAIIETGHVMGKNGTQNVFGEEQLQLDVASNDLLVERFKNCPSVSLIASEELDEAIECHSQADSTEKFSVAFDPLDGSSLVDVNFAVGSIFGIYKGHGFIGRKPSEQVAAVIAVYGPRTVLFCSVGQGVHEYTFRENDFFLTQENLRVAEEGAYFAPGNLRACAKSPSYQKMLDYWLKHQYTLRYSGGMVPDIAHILKKGKGIFAYPGYEDAPRGKLRLLFECGPMAFLMEQAGGVAIDGSHDGRADGSRRILDQVLDELTQRTPIFIGSKKEVEKICG